MASNVDIANRALQKVGAARISSLDEGSREANAVKAAYDLTLKAELQRNLWTFAIRRASLAADAETPAFGRTYQYSLPPDYIRKAPLDPTTPPLPDDILTEGRKLLTSDSGPLHIRYVSSTLDEETVDPLFVEALAAKLAYEICQELTQSESKQAALADDYRFAVSQAKSLNSIQAGPREPEVDEWVYVRTQGNSDVYPYGYTGTT